MSDLEYDKLDEESIARAAGFLPESLVRRMNKKIKSLEAKLQIAIEALEKYDDQSNWLIYKSPAIYGKKVFITGVHGWGIAREALEKIKKETP